MAKQSITKFKINVAYRQGGRYKETGMAKMSYLDIVVTPLETSPDDVVIPIRRWNTVPNTTTFGYIPKKKHDNIPKTYNNHPFDHYSAEPLEFDGLVSFHEMMKAIGG